LFNSQHDKAAVEWILTAKAGLKLINDERCNEQIFLIRYEDLLYNPDDTLTDIFDFCSLPDNKDVHRYFKKIHQKPRKWQYQPLSPVIQPVFNRVMDAFGYYNL
jgi:hypothetical protein